MWTMFTSIGRQFKLAAEWVEQLLSGGRSGLAWRQGRKVLEAWLGLKLLDQVVRREEVFGNAVVDRQGEVFVRFITRRRVRWERRREYQGGVTVEFSGRLHMYGRVD